MFNLKTYTVATEKQVLKESSETKFKRILVTRTKFKVFELTTFSNNIRNVFNYSSANVVTTVLNIKQELRIITGKTHYQTKFKHLREA